MSGRKKGIVVLVLLWGLSSWAAAEDDFTLYRLLEPASHSFAIVYDVTVSSSGQKRYFNVIRAGSEARDEKVIDRATGRELKWTLVTGKQALEEGAAEDEVSPDSRYIQIELPAPVPEGGETRLRIFKTYEDPKSYFEEGNDIVFDRPLSIRRNAVVLPPGYEVIESTVPSIVSTLTDGSVKLSFLNDREDSLPVRIRARRLPSKEQP